VVKTGRIRHLNQYVSNTNNTSVQNAISTALGKMKATINQNTDYEISWSSEDAITPELVSRILKQGDEMDVDWSESPFYNVVELLLEKYTSGLLEEMLYDEDPELIEICLLILQNPMKSEFEESDENLREFVRLYFPVMILLIPKIVK